MNIIKKNLTAIQKKFQSLKLTHTLYEQPIPISQVAESMTEGVVRQAQVDNYLKFISTTEEKDSLQNINQKWQQMTFEQMILFLDKVIQHKNANINNNEIPKKRLAISPKMKKTKKLNSDSHQNPYIPKKIQLKQMPNENPNIKDSNQQTQNFPNQNHQKFQEEEQFTQNDDRLEEIEDDQNLTNDSNLVINKKIKKKKIHPDLPQNFKSLNVQERYSILSSKFGKDKKILQKRFDVIYKHYRKEMYIPNESFQINNQLLMDLRVFLKYFKEFQLNKSFKTNEALKHFKKIASNGLWLNDKNFNEIHYNLVDIIDVNLSESNLDFSEPAKVDIQKKESMKKMKILYENLLKLKELSDLISDSKIKSIFNASPVKGIVKKIVEVHSGLIKDDVLLKLKERIQERKNKKNANFTSQNIKTWSPYKKKQGKSKELPSQREYLHKISLYKQLQLPTLRSREMKKSSVYSSLQILNIQKQKQKLRLLIKDQQSQKHLKQFFKNQKSIDHLKRSSSMNNAFNLIDYTKNNVGMNSLMSLRLSDSTKRSSLVQRNFSLPRLKFT